MFPIKDLQLIYKFPNTDDTFSEGDLVEGALTFTLSKQVKVKSVLVKLKGDANVSWEEETGDDKSSYSDRRRYFKSKQYLVEQNKDTVLPSGANSFKFELLFPQGDLPSSFRGFAGNITYKLEAKISRRWRMPSRIQKELNFMSKSLTNYGHLMCPHSGSLCKDVGMFSKGQVNLSVTTDRNIYCPGETVSVSAKISNVSSKNMRPKFRLQQNIKYQARSSSTASEKCLCKAVGDTMQENSEASVSCKIVIPADVTPTIRNCEIILVEYYLKVYLDMKFARDPELRLPLVILPSRFASLLPTGAIGASGYCDFPVGRHLVPTPSGGHVHPASNPAKHGNTSGYSNQWPQQVATPSGYSAAAFPPSLGQQHSPTAPPQFQEEEPPSYNSLFHPL